MRLHNLYSKVPGAASHQSKLLINYRCHPAIVRLPSRLFYECSIQVRTSVCSDSYKSTIINHINGTSQLRREKATGKKGPATALELGTYALSRSFSHASHGDRPRSFRPPSPLCTGHRCAAIQRRLRPAPRGWYCVLCDGSRLSGA